MTAYSDIDLGQVFCGVHLRAISQGMLMNLTCSEVTYSTLGPFGPEGIVKPCVVFPSRPCYGSTALYSTQSFYDSDWGPCLAQASRGLAIPRFLVNFQGFVWLSMIQYIAIIRPQSANGRHNFVRYRNVQLFRYGSYSCGLNYVIRHI